MAIETQTIEYSGDGLAMVGTLYADTAQSGPRPAVLLFPEAPGPGNQVQGRARRLAEAGYAAMACDLHGGGTIKTDMAEIMSILDELRPNPARIRARAGSALEALRASPLVDPARIAAIGYCFGGTMALELGRSGAAIAGIVGFHSGLATAAPQDARNIGCPVLVCIGADDPGIPPAQRAAFEEEMRAGGVDWTMHLYGGVVHSFTNTDAEKFGRPEFARYDASADKRSWAAMMALFDGVFA
ncbi:dienelactone hydrolase [Sphingomonas sp. Root710]|uniref:dienelactone hydrolase family protein n=1 Tax=Sphingomonas sp. Root710 TaxID=1736594 RepID=UPI0006FA6B0A|nr:dienelactone hydrolase family protein [Sphingomonas sp. Root710]KRB81414.1 dienelactone hydrolase [Sphingomonas sp. Root710]